MNFKKKFITTSLAVMMVMLLFAGCKSNAVDCSVKDREVVIDGDYDDWQNRLNYFEDEDVSLGMMYDSTSLYLCILARDGQLVRQAMGNGLSIWMDGKGGKNKSFGLKYPTGMMSAVQNMPSENMERSAEEPDESGMMRMRGSRAERMDMFENENAKAMLREIHILGDEEDRMSLSEAESFGIKAAFGQSEDYYVLEIKAPLVRSDITPYAIGEEASKRISVGFESEMPDFMNSRKGNRDSGGRGMGGTPPGGGGMGGGRRGGGMGGRGGGRSMGGSGGGPGSGQMQKPEAVKIWIKANLLVD